MEIFYQNPKVVKDNLKSSYLYSKMRIFYPNPKVVKDNLKSSYL
nr:hypothetical protein pmam_339 [Pithovirus mammoth]